MDALAVGFNVNYLLDALSERVTLNYMDLQNYLIYTRALVKAPDIFGNTTTTTEAMQSYNNLFANEVNSIQRIINATEGGIPIPSVHNLSLKEALNTYCHKSIQEVKNTFSAKTKLPSKTDALTAALQAQGEKLSALRRNLLDIKNRFLKNTIRAGERQFVSEMETLYSSLVEDIDTIQLLQGYSYSNFLQWNQKYAEINRKAQSCTEEEILQLKLERDRPFLDILIETTDYLRQAFENMEVQSSLYKTN